MMHKMPIWTLVVAIGMILTFLFGMMWLVLLESRFKNIEKTKRMQIMIEYCERNNAPVTGNGYAMRCTVDKKNNSSE